MLIASPVCSGNGLYLESHIHKLLGILYMRSAAEIHEVGSGMVNADDFTLGNVLNELLLELLLGKKL